MVATLVTRACDQVCSVGTGKNENVNCIDLVKYVFSDGELVLRKDMKARASGSHQMRRGKISQRRGAVRSWSVETCDVNKGNSKRTGRMQKMTVGSR